MQERREFAGRFHELRRLVTENRKHLRPGDPQTTFVGRITLPLNREALTYDDGREHLVSLWHDVALNALNAEAEIARRLLVDMEVVNIMWVAGHASVGAQIKIDEMYEWARSEDWPATAIQGILLKRL